MGIGGMGLILVYYRMSGFTIEKENRSGGNLNQDFFVPMVEMRAECSVRFTEKSGLQLLSRERCNPL